MKCPICNKEMIRVEKESQQENRYFKSVTHFYCKKCKIYQGEFNPTNKETKLDKDAEMIEEDMEVWKESKKSVRRSMK